MFLFDNDDTARGYKDGASDASRNNSKSYIKSGLSLKYWIHGTHVLNSYIDGYNQGYSEELSKANDVYYSRTEKSVPNTPKEVAVSQGNNIKAVANADVIDQFYDELVRFNDALVEATSSLNNYIVSMENNTWADNNYYDFRQLFSKITHRVNGIDESVIKRSMLLLLKEHSDKVRKAKMGS